MKDVRGSLAFMLLIASSGACAGNSCVSLPSLPSGEPTTKCASHPCPPYYPKEALQQGLTGKVVLTIMVSASGRPTDIQVVASSSHKVLDLAAVRYAQRASFPIYRAAGSLRGTCYTADLPIEFTASEI